MHCLAGRDQGKAGMFLGRGQRFSEIRWPGKRSASLSEKLPGKLQGPVSRVAGVPTPPSCCSLPSLCEMIATVRHYQLGGRERPALPSSYTNDSSFSYIFSNGIEQMVLPRGRQFDPDHLCPEPRAGI